MQFSIEERRGAGRAHKTTDKRPVVITTETKREQGAVRLKSVSAYNQGWGRMQAMLKTKDGRIIGSRKLKLGEKCTFPVPPGHDACLVDVVDLTNGRR